MRLHALLLVAVAALASVKGDAAIEPIEAEARTGKGNRFRPPAVFLDGEAIAVLRFRELPPDLEPVWKVLDDGRRVRRYSFVSWLRRLGIEPSMLTHVHFHGGRDRVARIEGPALAGSDVLFSFSQDVRGKLRLEWPAGSPVSDTVDGVLAVALYRGLPAPRWSDEEARLLDGRDDAKELPGGMRVYVDGRLAAVARRAAVEGGRDLLPLLASLGVETHDIVAADLVFGDDASTRVRASALAGLHVEGVPGSGGPLLLSGSGRRVSALLLHSR